MAWMALELRGHESNANTKKTSSKGWREKKKKKTSVVRALRHSGTRVEKEAKKLND